MARKVPPGFYLGAADAMHAPFEPKTPCRNMETRPCVRLVFDDRQMYPINECPHHHCVRHEETYEEGKIYHEFKLDAKGDVELFSLGDPHDGPYCVRCERYFCRSCNPNLYQEYCEVQDPRLI
jgi:hypothetical protein